MRGFRSLVWAATAVLLVAARATSATLTIVNMDGPGEGFNDPTPVPPVGGNPRTTLGGQRLYVFQHAASIWGSLLPSGVVILVQAKFDPMFCTSSGAVLGSGGPGTVWRDFANAPVAGHWYHVALANRLAGSDLHAGDDLVLTFNSGIGGASCMPMGWYYGVDGNDGGRIELLPVVLHEMGHGLGFSTTTNGQTGGYLNGYPSIFDHFLLDAATGLHWDQMSSAQRAASAVSCQGLAWNGPNVKREAPAVLDDKPLLRVNSPPGIARDYAVGLAAFGPALQATGVTGVVALANDGFGITSNACEPLINGGTIQGRIALVDRGGCPFTTKVKNAQNAGAIAVVVADTMPGCPPAGMGGSDATITIPSVRVTQGDGATLRANIPAGLNLTLRVDPTLSNGADGQNRVLMYAPTPYAGGSSVSHWDTSPVPDLLMEPSLNSTLSSGVDLTRWLFADIGWTGGPTGTPDPPPGPPTPSLALAGFPNPIRDQGQVQFTLPEAGPVTLELVDLRGRTVARLIDGRVLPAGAQSAPLDPASLGNGIYFLRLAASGEVRTLKIALAR